MLLDFPSKKFLPDTVQFLLLTLGAECHEEIRAVIFSGVPLLLHFLKKCPSKTQLPVHPCDATNGNI